MSAFLVVLGLLGCLTQCGNERTALERTIVLPNDHDGWVVIEYGVDGALTPSAADGQTRVTVPATGRTQLSTPFQSGRTSDQYQLTNGTAMHTLTADRLSRGDEHDAVRPTPFVCCGGTRTVQDVSGGGAKRVFEYFYVGKGPAGETPTIP